MAGHHSEDHPGASASRALSENAIVRTSRLKRNAQGYWLVTYSEPDGEGGWRSKRFSTQTKDPAAAQEALEDWLNSAREDAQLAGRQKQFSVGDLLDLYAEAKRLRPTEQASYTIKPLRTLLGGLAPVELNRRVIENYKRLRQNTRTAGALSTSTLRRELGTLIAALNHGIKEKHIAEAPSIELPDETPPRVTFMTPAQEVAFWDAAQRHGGEIALFVALGLETAARKGAILGLTWERVDFAHSLIDFREPGKAANRKVRVVVPMSLRLRPVLERAAQPAGRVFSGQLRRRYVSFTRAIGMEWVTAHVMRHTWASLAAQDGVPMLHIAKMLGDTLATVEHTYAHLGPTHLHDVVNRRWNPAGGNSA